MNGVMGGLTGGGTRRREAQQILAVVSGVLATDQIVKWMIAVGSDVTREIAIVPWATVASLVSLALSAIALIVLFDAKMVSAPVAGLILGGMTSAVIDSLATPALAISISVADVAVFGAVGWWLVITVLGRLAWREPTVHARSHHRLAA